MKLNIPTYFDLALLWCSEFAQKFSKFYPMLTQENNNLNGIHWFFIIHKIIQSLKH